MYGLPSSVDLSFLQGTTLLQLCIGENEVVFRLDPDVDIMVATEVRITLLTQIHVTSDSASDAGRSVMHLIGKSVHRALGTRDGTLKLDWDNGESLEIFDTSPFYESYTIHHPGGIIVV